MDAGNYKIVASRNDLSIEIKGAQEVIALISLYVHILFLTPIIGQLFFFSAADHPILLGTYLLVIDSSSHMIMQVELGFHNGVVDDIFYASGYDIRGHVVAQVITANISIEFL